MKKLLLASAIGTMLTAGVAIAMQTETPGAAKAPMTQAQMMARADARFDAMDANKDGQLSADERKAGMDRAREARATRNGSEKAMSGAGRRGGGRMAERMMGRVDTNGDGMISRAENRAAVETRFSRRDADKSGTIEAGERRAKGKRMGMRGPRGGGMMKKADTNGDGAVSRTEFDAASAMRFTRMDANRDGKIDAADRAARRAAKASTTSTPGE